MATYTMQQIAKAIGITTGQLDKWILRGFYKPDPVPPGKRAREYHFEDAVFLAALVSLRGLGITMRHAVSIATAALKAKDPSAPVLKNNVGVSLDIQIIQTRLTKALAKALKENV